jgi:hypothetical protein
MYTNLFHKNIVPSFRRLFQPRQGGHDRPEPGRFRKAPCKHLILRKHWHECTRPFSATISLFFSDDDFSRGKEDTFFITDRNLGSLRKLRISHNGEVGWHLARIHITNVDTDVHATFLCNNWIENGDPDQRTEKELEAADESELGKRRETYLVRIYTSDRQNAGTDATVSFVLYGEYGETTEQRLQGKGTA